MFLYHVFTWLLNTFSGLNIPTVSYDILCAKNLYSQGTHVLIGNMLLTDFEDPNEFIQELQSMINKLEKHSENPFTIYNRDLTSTLNQLHSLKTRLLAGHRGTLIRPQPFGIIVAGLPGTGKTFGTQRLIKDLLASIGIVLSADDIVVLNETDEFQSEYRSNHKVVIFDDLGASRVSITGIDPFRKLIDFINNVPKTALNPNLELKGNVWIRPDVVGVTTNLEVPFKADRDNGAIVMCPDALNRRFPVMIYQVGFTKFKLLKLGSDYLTDMANMNAMVTLLPELTYDQLLAKIVPVFQKHVSDQIAFVNMVEDEFTPKELAPESSDAMLLYSLIIQLQAAVRLFISYKSLDNDPETAALVAILRRFIAYDFQKLKMSQRKDIVLTLKSYGYTPSDVRLQIETLETLLRGSTNIGICLANLGDTNKLVKCVLAIVSNESVRYVCKRWFPGCTLVYDLGSVFFPYCIAKLNEYFCFSEKLKAIVHPKLQPEGVSYKDKLKVLLLRGKKKNLELLPSQTSDLIYRYLPPAQENGANNDNSVNKSMRLYYKGEITLPDLLRASASHYETEDHILLPNVQLRNFSLSPGDDSLFLCKRTNRVFWLSSIKYTKKFRYRGWFEFLRTIAKHYDVYLLGFTDAGLICAAIHTDFESTVWSDVHRVITQQKVRDTFPLLFSEGDKISVIRARIANDLSVKPAPLV